MATRAKSSQGIFYNNYTITSGRFLHHGYAIFHNYSNSTETLNDHPYLRHLDLARQESEFASEDPLSNDNTVIELHWTTISSLITGPRSILAYSSSSFTHRKFRIPSPFHDSVAHFSIILLYCNNIFMRRQKQLVKISPFMTSNRQQTLTITIKRSNMEYSESHKTADGRLYVAVIFDESSLNSNLKWQHLHEKHSFVSDIWYSQYSQERENSAN